jgi:hypothetical protein
VSDQICSKCVHAALDSGGVYCKLFHEAIFDERVAEECGEFEADIWPAPAAVERPVLVALPTPHEYRGWVDEYDVGNTCCLAPRLDPIHVLPPGDRERTLSLEIHLDYFGKEENGDKIVQNLVRELALSYGERVKVKRL